MPIGILLAAEDDGLGFFRGVGGIACCITILAICVGIPLWFLRYFLQEHAKGRKMGMTDEEVIDSMPKKRQVMFKGEKAPEWKIAGRSKATRAILKFLSYTDNWFEKKYVGDVVEEAFRLIKEAVEHRSTRGIERRCTPDCLAEIEEEIQKAKKAHERHIFDRIEVTDVNVLHVEAPAGKERHTFTALVSARSKDYIADDEDDEVVRGDRKTYAYQELWTFRRTPKRWVVELIRPTTDIDSVLESKNVLAQIDLEEFAKDAPPEFLREVVGR
jgi:predicted lipid-binding transport protein (Tim44 family)